MNKLSLGVSPTEVAARLGVRPDTVRQWCKKLGFGHKVGGRFRISEARIAEIERNLSEGGTGMPTPGASK